MRSFPTARNPLLSLLQSAAAALDRRNARAGTGSDMRQEVDSLVKQLPNPTAGYAGATADPVTVVGCAGLGWHLLQAHIDGDHARRAALENRIRFSACDPGWSIAIAEYVRRFLPGGDLKAVPYRRWQTQDDFVITAPAAALRIGLLSDWGTGTGEARAVAALLARQRPDVVIHLGDIYYSGTREECALHFLTPLRAAMPDAKLLTLCGNHDVYSGGGGYYGLLDQIGQPASYFCLRAPDQSWQLLAADTGRNDNDPFTSSTAHTSMDPAEIVWHEDKLRDFPGRTIFLSHHQPFSAFAQIGPPDAHDPVNPFLLEAHDRLAAVGPIDAWFWGHEHSLRLYAPYRGVAQGRNIGFGAVPVAANRAPTKPLAGLVDPPALAAEITLDVVEGAYTHGFAVLDMRAAAIEASYWCLTHPDAPIYRETLASAATV